MKNLLHTQRPNKSIEITRSNSKYNIQHSNFSLKFVILSLFFGMMGKVWGQLSCYSFNASSGTYTALSSPTSLRTSNGSNIDEFVSSAVTIPSFKFAGQSYTSAYVTSNGLISLGGTAPATLGFTGISSTIGSGICICPFNCDLTHVYSNSSTNISYKDLTASNEFVFQWTGMRRYAATEEFNFQVRLNYSTGEIKFVYSLISGPASSTAYQPEVGIRSSATSFLNLSVTDVSGNPTWSTPTSSGNSNTATCRFTSTSNSKSFSTGLTYTFTPSSISGTYTINSSSVTGGTNYQTFTDAINDLNCRNISGAVTFNVSAGQTFAEKPPAITAIGTSTNTITFQKSGVGNNPKITPTGTGTTDFGICISGGDYITFDGIDIDASAATTSTNAIEFGYLIRNGSATNGAQYNTIQNCTVTLNKNYISAAANACIFTSVSSTQGGVTPTASTGANSNNKFYNLTLSNAQNGIYAVGNATYPDLSCEFGVAGSGCQTTRNSVSNLGGVFSGSAYGVYAQYQSGAKIFNFDISNIRSNGNTNTTAGILLINFAGTNEIYNNKVNNVSTTGTAATARSVGVELQNSSGTPTARVYNNFIYDIKSSFTGAATITIYSYGIYSNNTVSAAVSEIDNNSVYLSVASGTPTYSSVCYAMASGTAVQKIRGNIFVNAFPAQGATAKHFCWLSTSTTSIGAAGSISNYNDLFITTDAGTSGHVGRGSTTNYNTLANWQARSDAPDANSLSIDPTFTSSTDLHASASGVDAVSGFTPQAWITSDIDCETRSSYTPSDLGADCFSRLPSCASYTSPTDAATGQLQTGVDLTWSAATLATSYDVYFGTDNPPTNILNGTNQSGTTYATSALSASQTYYWKIVPKNSAGSASGCTVWSFTTQAATPTLSTNPASPTALAFGNQCQSSTSSAQSFTMTALNLTGTYVIVTAPTGFSVSENGTDYYSSINVNHSSGAFTTKTIYVKFTPGTVTSFNSNVVISGGGLTADVNVAVTGTGVNNLAGLSYSSSTVTYCTATAISTNSASLSTTGGTVSYSGTLPGGLSLNSSTGAITGTPLSASSAQNYTITASNTCSNTTADVNITVYTTLSGLTYTTHSVNYCVGSAISANAVTAISGTGTITYSVSPALPTGLNLNTATGEITGTPSALTASNTYTVTATNGGCNTTRVLTIAVVNTASTASTGASSNLSTTSATAAGSFVANCQTITEYGIEYSTTNGFADGAGTKVVSTNQVLSSYSSNLSGLTQSTVYYYKAYATYGATTVYGSQSSFTTTCNPLSGTLTIGASGYHYTTLTSALSALTTCGYTGNIVLELQSNYVSSSESFPITFGSSLGSSASKTITILPASGATNLSITSANTTATIDLNGGSYVTFDGRAGGSGSARNLSIGNTGGAAVPAIRFINDANNNTFQYCTVTSSVTTTTSGLVVFSNTNGSNGNDNNTIDNCDLNGAGTAANIIYASGSASPADNSGNTISNNLIRNHFVAGSATNGILISSGNTNWTISGNSIFQEATRTYSAGNTHTGININNSSGNNFVISGNYIGGSQTSCGGTQMTLTGTGLTQNYHGILLSVGTTTASSVQNNSISNIFFNTQSTGVFNGISITAGNANIGNTTANTIGATTGNGSITFQTNSITGPVFSGINSSSAGTVTISNNLVGSVNLTTASVNTLIGSFYGIRATAGATTTITFNVIGSTITSNSINNSGGKNSTTNASIMRGISYEGTGTVSISSNNVSNIAYSATGGTGPSTGVNVFGIAATGGTNTISGNTVCNLSNVSANSGSGTSASICGLLINASSTNHTVSNNSIYALSNNCVSATVVYVNGIYYNSSTGTNLIEKNLVYNISTTSTGASYLNGIAAVGGTAFYQNNVVRMGYNETGASSITGGHIMSGIVESAGTNKFYHNSVFIGGTSVTGSSVSAAFRTTITASTSRAYQNNIFVNARSNGTGTGKHYAIYSSATTSTGITSDYNDLFVSGTGGLIGYFNSVDRTALSDWRTATSKDANSISSDPNFTNATTSTPDLSLSTSGSGTPCDAAGTAIGSVTDDFNSSTRSSYTPSDIGAFVVVGPLITNSGTLTAFSACTNVASSEQSFTVSGSNLSANIVITPPTGFEISQTSGSGFNSTAITLIHSSGTVSSTTIYARMAALASSPTSGNITCTSTGATTKNIAVSGTVTNTAATATTGASSNVASTSATAAGSYVANCQSITAYGIEYSTTNGFANGAGTQVASTNQTGGSFTSSLTGLSSNTTYYFKAYATNASGATVWGSQSSFTTTCASVDLPYTENFESVTVPGFTACTAVQNAGSGNTWYTKLETDVDYQFGFTTNHLRYQWNSSNAANTWFYTKGLNLTGGVTYSLSFDYGGTGTSFPEKLKVSYGTSQSSAAMTNTIATYSNVTNSTPNSVNLTFTPATSGVFYIGFNAYSNANMFYLMVDNIQVIQPSPPTITSFTPSNVCASIGETVTITGTNFTGATEVSIGGTPAASYIVNSATQITATIGAGTTGTISVTNVAGTASSAQSLTVNSLPSNPGNPTSNSPQCQTPGVTLTRSGSPSGGDTWYWQTSSSGTATSNLGSTYNVNTTGTYYIRAQSAAGCWSSGTGSLSVTVNPAPTAITITPSSATICNGQIEDLVVSGGNSIADGIATIGTGTTLTTASEQPTAFCNRWPSYRMQTVYTSSELQAAGLNSGNITSMAFNITTLGDAATNANFIVKIGNTASSTLSGSFVSTATGFTTVYPSQTYTHTSSGWQTISFSTPFNWNGTSNIIVEIIHDGADIFDNSTTYYTATAGNTVAYTPTTSSDAASFSNKRLNVRFGGQVTSSSQVSWSSTSSLYTDASATVSYAGNPTTVYAKPSTTTTYTATATGSNGCTSSNNVEVTVNTPSIPFSITGTPYYIWRGETSTAYSTASNWYYWDGSVYSIANSAPGTSSKIIIPSGTCVSSTNTPEISGVTTSGPISVLNGGKLTISNTFDAYGDVIIKDGGGIVFQSNGVFEIHDGHLTFEGTTSYLTPSTGSFKFHTTTAATHGHQLTCNSNSNSFYNLEFHGDASLAVYDFILESDINVSNEMKVVTNNVKLNNHKVNLGATGYITEGTNGKKFFDLGTGYFEATRTIGSSATVNAGNLGLTIQAASGKPLGSTIIKRYHTSISNDLDGLYNAAISRYYNVTPQYNGGDGNTYTDGLGATVTLNYSTATIDPSIDDSRLAMYRKGQGENSWQKLDNGALSLSNKTYTFTNFPKFSDVTLGGGGSPLPVDLLSFSGNCDDGKVSLQWKTASEHNSAYFEVQKSRDGENWQVLTTIPAAGNSNHILTYNTIDINAVSHNNYYRLKQVDIDGTNKQYTIINVGCNEFEKGYFTSYPNPSGSSFQLVVNDKELLGNSVLNIVDSRGVVVVQREITVESGVNLYVINEHFSPGIYFINITNGNKSTAVIRHSVK